MIERKKLIQKHNPILEKIDYSAPLSVGNGSFAYTVDVTGMQSIAGSYARFGCPLLTMSDWGWHTKPDENGKCYTLNDVEMTEYDYNGRKVRYGVEKKSGNEAIYDWVRQNPHRFNLANIALEYDGKVFEPEALIDIRQELDLYSGIIRSEFMIENCKVIVETVCHGKSDTLGFSVLIKGEPKKKFSVRMTFPYPSHVMEGSDWLVPQKHQTTVKENSDKLYCFERSADDQNWYIGIKGKHIPSIVQEDMHQFRFTLEENYETTFTAGFSKTYDDLAMVDFEECKRSARIMWSDFWEKGGIISFEGSKDLRAMELERRMVLSLYLSRINCCTKMPPQETGLTVNSWYGKAHLEMHFWHQAYLPLWGRGELLERTLEWYKHILPKAKENAKRNGYKGARWPKMVGPEGIDCPSKIAMLLVWQQPHILYMLELLYQTGGKERVLLEKYWEEIFETAEFMVDFAVYNKDKDCYELVAPLIPAQERHKPMDTLNPAFELEYWRFGLYIAMEWAKRLDKQVPAVWKLVHEKMAVPVIMEGVYPAHEKCYDTYTRFAEDHPSMTAILGILPGVRVDRMAMERTLKEIERTWNFKAMWGWDFAMMAMTYTRMYHGKEAVDVLLRDTQKNTYEKNGHNVQEGRKDLPLYLPGNGSLLLALALMTMGWKGCEKDMPGFPSDGSWHVEMEGMNIMPF